MAIIQSRRRFVINAAVAGAAGFSALGAISRAGGAKSLATEPPPAGGCRDRKMCSGC